MASSTRNTSITQDNASSSSLMWSPLMIAPSQTSLRHTLRDDKLMTFSLLCYRNIHVAGDRSLMNLRVHSIQVLAIFRCNPTVLQDFFASKNLYRKQTSLFWPFLTAREQLPGWCLQKGNRRIWRKVGSSLVTWHATMCFIALPNRYFIRPGKINNKMGK